MPQKRAMTILSLKIASLLIIDVRRTDYEGGVIRGSLNIPAQGFWWNRGTPSRDFLCSSNRSHLEKNLLMFYISTGMLYELCYKAGIEWVVFTCNSCSLNGRGPRCAAWFLEHVRNVAEDNDMQVMALEGGIKGWVKAGPEYTQLMDGYNEDYWQDTLAKDDRGKAQAANTDTQ